tara:strand:- start:673 stop:966 length:294 start_codon:yes stop_codon:yes gene_type:complete
MLKRIKRAHGSSALEKALDYVGKKTEVKDKAGKNVKDKDGKVVRQKGNKKSSVRTTNRISERNKELMRKDRRTTGKKPKTTSPTSKTKALRYSPGSY